MDLRQYEAAKFELAEILRTIGTAAGARDDLRSRVTELLTRLAEDRFNLVVAGRFSRGKTTLMNAILGLDRLPTGILPLTSVITRVIYGSRERVRVEFERGAMGFEVPMEALPDYITEHGNPGNVRRIRAASIELPAEILRRGFCFIDTPGLGSAIAENTRTTAAFLPEADAVILVSGYDGPLTEDELRAAGSLARASRKLFFVLNKRDLAAPQARPQVQEYVQARLAEACGRDAPPIFSLSAREALVAKRQANAADAAASGIDELERALTRFLIDEKSAQLLRSMYDRASQLLAALDGDTAPLQTRLDELAGSFRDRSSVTAAAVRGTGRDGPRESSHDPECGSGHDAARESGHDAARAAEHRVRMEDCVICARVVDTLFDFMRKYQYDLAARGGERERLTSSGGLCGPHMWLYASMASDRDVCVALTPLAKRLAADLRAAGSSSSQPGGVREVPYHAAPDCLLCAVQDEAQSRAISELALQHEAAMGAEPGAPPGAPPGTAPGVALGIALGIAPGAVSGTRPGGTPGTEGRAAPRGAPAGLPSICLPHLRLLESQLGDRPLTRALERRQSMAVERLAEDMQRYVIKRDAIRSGLASDEETQAARRATAFIAGHRAMAPRGRAP